MSALAEEKAITASTSDILSIFGRRKQNTEPRDAQGAIDLYLPRPLHGAHMAQEQLPCRPIRMHSDLKKACY